MRYMNSKKMGKQRRKMKKLMAKESSGLVEKGTTKTSLIAWCANASHGDTFYQRQRMTHYYYQLTGGQKNENLSR